ncbi:MAG: hypothetical protein JWR67_1700 [Mucilaginibacter sp.]|nr:hypothetical protein [Mucilaginibacter sp.]
MDIMPNGANNMEVFYQLYGEEIKEYGLGGYLRIPAPVWKSMLEKDLRSFKKLRKSKTDSNDIAKQQTLQVKNLFELVYRIFAF